MKEEFIATEDLRTKTAELLKNLKENIYIVNRYQRPNAVLMDFSLYRELRKNIKNIS
jgi:hypothetical protein